MTPTPPILGGSLEVLSPSTVFRVLTGSGVWGLSRAALFVQLAGILFSSRTAVGVLSPKHISEFRFPSLALELINHNKNRLEHWVRKVGVRMELEGFVQVLPMLPISYTFCHLISDLRSA